MENSKAEAQEKPKKDRTTVYGFPIGTRFSLGKREWQLIHRDSMHPDFMTFREISKGAHTPDRIFNPSEIQDLYSRGIIFWIPIMTATGIMSPPAPFLPNRS